MKDRKEIRQEFLTGERALFKSQGLDIYDTIFDDGESPLKESRDISLEGCFFRWKYPLWYCKNVEVKNCTWFEMGRAGVWYTDDINVEDSIVAGPKNFRKCKNLTLKNVTFPDAQETLWWCQNVSMDNVKARGNYFAMNTDNIMVNGLELVGNYSFDGCKNVEVHNSKLISKDAFWNTENVTVYDSFITGEYLGWNARNLTLINCTIESLQGLCYIDNLVMEDCRLINTTLAFEYSSLDAQITGKVDSILNPTSGQISAGEIGELIIEKDRVDPEKIKIICNNISKVN